MTPYEREAIAKMFKDAKVFLEQDKCEFICTALYHAMPTPKPPHTGTLTQHSEEHRIYRLAKGVVQERLERRASLESWLRWQGFFLPKHFTPELKLKLRNHRLQWLDLLIAEFERKES